MGKVHVHNLKNKKMTIQDILNKELIGKTVKVHSSEFRITKNSEPQLRYYLKIADAKLLAKKDKRLKYLGESIIKIKYVDCYSIDYEGDSIYLILDVDGYNSLNITVLDELEIE
jgi:hypothetical protein